MVARKSALYNELRGVVGLFTPPTLGDSGRNRYLLRQRRVRRSSWCSEPQGRHQLADTVASPQFRDFLLTCPHTLPGYRAPGLHTVDGQDLAADLSVREPVAVNIEVEKPIIQVAYLLTAQRSDAARLGATRRRRAVRRRRDKEPDTRVLSR